MARLFGTTGPDAYMSIYKDIEFRESLASNPLSVDPKEVKVKEAFFRGR
jgi:hypothetical protein